MKFIFPALSILICAVVAYFGLQLSENFKATQDARLLALDTRKSVIASTDKTNSEIQNERKLLDVAKTRLVVATEEVNTIMPETSSLKKELSKLEASLKAQTMEFEANEKSLSDLKLLLTDSGLSDNLDAENLAERVADFEKKSEELEGKIEELDTLLAQATDQLENSKKQLDGIVERKKSRDLGISKNSLVARITSVDMEWGFVVIGAGVNSGFKPQSVLLVERDGQYIGKIEPSAIEQTQTIAEVDFSSLSPGTRIQPGDNVILARPNAN